MTIVSGTEILIESHLKSEKKTNEQNSRRRTRSIGRSKKTPAVNQLEAKAASYRQELAMDTAEISLFLRSDSGVQREGRKGERRFALTPTPPPRCCCCFFFSAHISLRCPHDLNSWNRLSRDKSRDQCSMSRNIQITEQKIYR